MRNTSNVWLSILVALSGLLCACSCNTATKLIGHYPLSGFTTNNPEVVCVDRDHNCVWIADDSSKSVLHKVEFTNL